MVGSLMEGRAQPSGYFRAATTNTLLTEFQIPQRRSMLIRGNDCASTMVIIIHVPSRSGSSHFTNRSN